MLMALFELLGIRIVSRLSFPRPLAALRSGARSVRSGFASMLQVEVAIWALLQSIAVWMTVVTAMLLAGCAAFDGSKARGELIDPATLSTVATLTPTAPDASAAASSPTVAPGGPLSPSTSATPWPAEGWWKQFDDPALNALIDEAFANGGTIDLRLAESRLQGAQALLRGARGGLLPTLELNASFLRQHYPENYIYPPPLAGGNYNQGDASLDFRYEIDFWGRNRSLIAAAQAQSISAEADSQAARLALSTSLARAWFQLQRLYSLRDVTELAIRQRGDVLTLAQQRFDAGIDTNAELRQAEAALPSARVDLAQIDESIGLVRDQIAALLGKGPDRGRDIGVPKGSASTVIAMPASLPVELVGRRPDLVAARWRVEAARGQIEAAKAQFYPNINLIASAGFLAIGAGNFLQTDSRNLSAGPALTLPIFEGGRLRANLAGRNADYDTAVEQYNATLVDAVRDVADQIVSLQSVNAQFADQELARTKTEQAFDVAVVRYKAGLTTYLTVLNAQTLVLQQQRADTELRARVLELNVALVRALGGGYRADVLPTPASSTPALPTPVSRTPVSPTPLASR